MFTARPNPRPERVTKWVFDLNSRSWTASEIHVAIDERPFSRGSMRTCYKMLDLSLPKGQNEFVAKLSNDAKDSANVYRQDVEMQMQCQKFADLYNRTSPPKLVRFNPCFLIECSSREDKRLYFIEPFLRGTYQKYSNNFGFVLGGDYSRNTPQAFSHFTYHVSAGLMLVCDIQGVDDIYTDPQIHTVDAVVGRRDNRFGKGNVGVKGIRRFFESHRCNSVCHYLELPSIGRGVKPPQPPPQSGAIAPGMVPHVFGSGGGSSGPVGSSGARAGGGVAHHPSSSIQQQQQQQQQQQPAQGQRR